MADLTHDQIAEWEKWFQGLSEEARRARPAGFYALTDMARQYLKSVERQYASSGDGDRGA